MGGGAARPSYDRRAARWWRERRRLRIVEEADRARNRTILCQHFGLTREEHDRLTFEELGVYNDVMAGVDGTG